MTTELITAIAQLRERISEARAAGKIVGCVPTMGALHAGHGALIERARNESDVVVVTIFVNPIQFDRKEDYERYTRELTSDMAFCEARGADVVFAPSVEEMYPQPTSTFVGTELGNHLCGAFRPGHFRGVATVVAKLFNIVQPDIAYFGEKDAQQLTILRQMVQDLNFAVTIVPVPTVREPDGLALSSRNVRLTSEQRSVAPVLFAALTVGRNAILNGQRDPAQVKAQMLNVLDPCDDVRVEYMEVVDAARMQPVQVIAGDVRLAGAVWLGSTRLIDNVFVSVEL
jgi:pantoate--beta-alanine ligase